MNFDNQSKLQAELFTGSTAEGEDIMITQVVGKAIGRWDKTGRFSMDWEEDAPIIDAPSETPWGFMPSDLGTGPRKSGTDVVALGRAYSPDPMGSPYSYVTLSVNGDARHLLVYGDRYWERRGEQLVASEPEPFVAFDLQWSRAFGGQSMDEYGEDIVFPYNAEGQGYQSSEEVAEGERLPNLEDPNHLIKRWSDTPCPCNIAPIPPHLPIAYYDAQRIQQLVEPLQQGKQIKVPTFLGHIAHPNFQFPALHPRSHIKLTGMTPEAGLDLQVPKYSFGIIAELGKRRLMAEMVLDTLLLLPETKLCVFTWKSQFGFRFQPHEHRTIRLVSHVNR